MSVYDQQMIIISLTGERRTLHTCTQQEVGPHTVKRKRGSKVTPGRNLCRADQRGALRKSENMKSDNQDETCSACGLWNDPNGSTEIEDEWVGCESCSETHWFHKNCCKDPSNPCGNDYNS
uniref:uncharacterized protein LOC120344547 n=1 Tax=Styela clava TaxID=7725 RepID=UPI00193A5224|nr:uncharacterized protein LOC120344547 [Styela clava]